MMIYSFWGELSFQVKSKDEQRHLEGYLGTYSCSSLQCFERSIKKTTNKQIKIFWCLKLTQYDVNAPQQIEATWSTFKKYFFSQITELCKLKGNPCVQSDEASGLHPKPEAEHWKTLTLINI